LPDDVRDFLEGANSHRAGTFDELRVEAMICDVTGDFLGYKAVYFKQMKGYREIVDVIEITDEQKGTNR
jgi:hypothetical protein